MYDETNGITDGNENRNPNAEAEEYSPDQRADSKEAAQSGAGADTEASAEAQGAQEPEETETQGGQASPQPYAEQTSDGQAYDEAQQDFDYSGAQSSQPGSDYDPYSDMSARDYKENIKRMKREYKQFQKDQKEAARASRAASDTQPYYYGSKKKGIGGFSAFIISLVTSFVIFGLVFAALAFFPSKNQSFLASFYGSLGSGSKGSSGETSNPSGNDVQIGDSTVSKGDNVTINVQGGASGYAQAVYAKASNSVVGIAVSQVSGSKWDQYENVVAMGSGVIYSADGIVITNCHVIEYAIGNTSSGINPNFTIRIYFKTDLSEWAYATEIVGYDSANDVAVLKVNATNLQPMEFADSDTLVTGETAIAIGSPGGLNYMNSISEGILSGLNRTVTTDNTVIYDLIQTTAAINPGNSGGALLNKEGKLIGMCVIKIASTEYESMGFAINSNTVKTIVESILKYGYYNKPLLGITIDTTYTAEIAEREGWKPGAYVEDVTSGGAADKAGITKEDVITKMNDTNISSFAELRRFLLYCEPGDVIKVEIYRPSSGQTLTVEVTLDATDPG